MNQTIKNPVINRLEKRYPQYLIDAAVYSETKEWSFTPVAKTLNPEFYRSIYHDHILLNIEYSLLRQQLHHNLMRLGESKQEDQITEELMAALMLAELLEHLHIHYLNVPREVKRLQKEQQIYRKMLRTRGMSFPSDAEEERIKYSDLNSSTLKVRENTSNLNWYRLLIIRAVRLLTVLEMFGSHMGNFTNFVLFVNVAANYTLPYISFLFFFPRVLINMGIILKHTIPGNWLSEEEKSLSWMLRFKEQLHRRYFELGNDVAWAIAGTINAFVFIGALSPLAIYVTLAAFSYDVVLSGYRFYHEINQYTQLKAHYAGLLQEESDPAQRQEIEEYLVQLNKRMDYEKLRFGIHFACTLIILASTTCALSLFFSIPVIPLLGAIGMVSISVVAYLSNTVLEYYRPKTSVDANLPQLAARKELQPGSSGIGFFRSGKTDNSVRGEKEEEHPSTPFRRVATFPTLSIAGSGA